MEVLTFFLILITAYYAWQTRETVIELRNQRILGSKPILVIKKILVNDPHAQGGNKSCLKCYLENIGGGPAFHIQVGLYDIKTDNCIGISENYIDYLTVNSKTDDNHIHIDNKYLNSLKYIHNSRKEMISPIKVVIHYKDMYENMHFSERILAVEKNDKKITPFLGTFKTESKTINMLKQSHKILKSTFFDKIILKFKSIRKT